jgi:hypothetical protein
MAHGDPISHPWEDAEIEAGRRAVEPSSDELIDIGLAADMCPVAQQALKKIHSQTGFGYADTIERVLSRLDTSPLGLRALFPELFGTNSNPLPDPRILDRDADDDAVPPAMVFGVEGSMYPNDYKMGDEIEMVAFTHAPDTKVTLKATVTGYEVKMPAGSPDFTTHKEFYNVSKVA